MDVNLAGTRRVANPNPRFGELNLHQWLLFLGAHEARHTAQVRETAASVPG